MDCTVLAWAARVSEAALTHSAGEAGQQRGGGTAVLWRAGPTACRHGGAGKGTEWRGEALEDALARGGCGYGDA